VVVYCYQADNVAMVVLVVRKKEGVKVVEHNLQCVQAAAVTFGYVGGIAYQMLLGVIDHCQAAEKRLY
jgi:hypothetical protein